MAIGTLTIALHPGVEPQDFERFATDELFPALKTVIRIRIGRTTVRHTLLRDRRTDDATGPARYLWKIEQTWFDAENYAFPVDVGPALKARLESFGTLTFAVAEADFGPILAETSDELTTPTDDFDESDPAGWITPPAES